jgi:GGDEF domain-containing protein
MQSGIAEREARLLHGARHDEVTGLPNRAHAEEWIARQLGVLAARDNVTVILLDVNNLQELSAALGFDMAQRLVVHIASALKMCANDTTFVA